MITATHLRHFHTRALLKAMRMSCISDEQLKKINEDRALVDLPPIEAYTSKEKYYEQAYVEPRALGYDDYTNVCITIAQLKAELAKRAHVPNKQESIALRKAKHQRGRKKGRKDR